jgi:hypothetical protein
LRVYGDSEQTVHRAVAKTMESVVDQTSLITLRAHVLSIPQWQLLKTAASRERCMGRIGSDLTPRKTSSKHAGRGFGANVASGVARTALSRARPRQKIDVATLLRSGSLHLLLLC